MCNRPPSWHIGSAIITRRRRRQQWQQRCALCRRRRATAEKLQQASRQLRRQHHKRTTIIAPRTALFPSLFTLLSQIHQPPTPHKNQLSLSDRHRGRHWKRTRPQCGQHFPPNASIPCDLVSWNPATRFAICTALLRYKHKTLTQAFLYLPECSITVIFKKRYPTSSYIFWNYHDRIFYAP